MALYTAGNLHSWSFRKGNQMKCIANTEKFPQKRPNEVIAGLPVVITHADRSIQNYHQIHGAGSLAEAAKSNPKHEYQDK